MPSTTFCSIETIDDPDLRKGLSKYGGLLLRIDVDNPPPTYEMCKKFSALMPRMLQHLDPWLARRDRIRKIHGGILECRVPGGFAGIASVPETFEFIGIAHGTIAGAMDRFYRIYAHPENQTNIGDSSKEEAPAIIDLGDHPLQQEELWRWVIPKCPIRRHVAEALTLVCLEMAVLHEFSHLANGHVDYLKELGNPEEPLLIQTLEMDADSTSLFLAIRIAYQKWAAFHSIKNGDAAWRAAHQILFSTPQRCFITILVAGYTFFRMFNKPWNQDKQKINSHPQYAMRMKGLADGLQENLRNRPMPGYTQDQFRVDAGNVYGATDRAFGLMTGTEPDRSIWESVFVGTASAEYFYNLERKWAEISPAIARHMKIAGLSPVDWSRIPQRQ